MSKLDVFTDESTPPTAFYFSVKFIGMDTIDSSFQEVSGLKATFGEEERKEGLFSDRRLNYDGPEQDG